MCGLTWPDLQALGVTGRGAYEVKLTVTDDQDLTHWARTDLIVVPDLATLSLLALGGFGLLASRRRKR